MNTLERSFNTWLKNQAGRNDEVGKLAQQATSDQAWPQNALLFEDFKGYLEQNGKQGNVEALAKAWQEYEVNQIGKQPT